VGAHCVRGVVLANHTRFLPVALSAADAAGRVIREGAWRPTGVRSKGLRDLLTDVDLAAERAILGIIRSRHPDHDVLTEESPPGERTSPYRWVIDPLDGTANFAHRYPCFCTSIALTLDDEPIAGVVYDPIREHLFSATLGGGATLNGERLRVGVTENLIEAFIGMDWTRDAPSRERNARIVAQLMPHSCALRICGSAALGICYVGAGWWEAYWHLGPQPWDTAAGTLIVREAGGRVTDLAGGPWRLGTGPYLASNGRLHRQICTQIAYTGGTDSQ
jgi:myo-inositol-1(or 4)-monophosphatase